jgi:hypothetical protein
MPVLMRRLSRRLQVPAEKIQKGGKAANPFGFNSAMDEGDRRDQKNPVFCRIVSTFCFQTVF